MFWGLIMEPMRRYTQKVKRAFRVTMASLDISSASNDATQVMYIFENRNYLLCTLKKDSVMQCHLDLVFDVDDEVSFMVNGKNHVHLTGYLETDIDDDFGENDEEEEEALEAKLTSKENANKKRKANEMKKEAKKLKTVKDLMENTITDEDGSDDSDFNIGNLMEDSDDDVEEEEQEDVDEEQEDDGIDSDGEEEVENEEDEIDDDDDDEDDESDEDEDEKPQMKSKKPTVNGTASKEKISRLEGNKKTPNKNEKQNEKVEKTPQKKQQINEKKTPSKESASPQKRTVEGGVIIEDLKIGNGQIAKPGRVVQVYYEGRFQKNNKLFDSANKGAGFKFRLGKQEVIKGWDVGLSGMKVGGKRRITCPPHMAYGQKGSPPAIPPNATLVFEVELKNVN